jgi:hypothetical protein
VGALFLFWLGSRFRSRLRPGDLLLVFFIWYGMTRFLLETLRADNWTFFGVPTAEIVSIVVIAIGVAGLIHRHRPRRAADRPPTRPELATWGALGATWMTRPIDEPWANVDDFDIDDEGDDEVADTGDNVTDEIGREADSQDRGEPPR